mgnify:FL=1
MDNVDESTEKEESTAAHSTSDVTFFVKTSRFDQVDQKKPLLSLKLWAEKKNIGKQIDPSLLKTFFGLFEQLEIFHQFAFIPKLFEFLKNNARFDDTTHDFITNLFYDRSEIDEIVNTLKRMFQVIQSFKTEASESVKTEDVQDEDMEAHPCKKRKCYVLNSEEIKNVKTEDIQDEDMEDHPCKKRKCDVLNSEEIKNVKTEEMMVDEMF